jgi:hypothetical protein
MVADGDTQRPQPHLRTAASATDMKLVLSRAECESKLRRDALGKHPAIAEQKIDD